MTRFFLIADTCEPNKPAPSTRYKTLVCFTVDHRQPGNHCIVSLNLIFLNFNRSAL